MLVWLFSSAKDSIELAWHSIELACQEVVLIFPMVTDPVAPEQQQWLVIAPGQTYESFLPIPQPTHIILPFKFNLMILQIVVCA
jgi:hypothetical protein